METQFNGPEMTPKKLAVLLSTAALVIVLFAVRTCSARPDCNQTADKEPEYVFISEFDSLFRACQDSLFDWKLLAAIAFVESRFDTSLVSPKGAAGLMQMMPSTFSAMLQEMGVDSTVATTELYVRASVLYLHHLDEKYSFIDVDERLNYILGGYNGGSNHVFDAMRLARRDGINRYRWNSLVPVLESLADDSVASDTLCQFGRFDATETIRYVASVQKKYAEYQLMELDFQTSKSIQDTIKQ